MNLNRKPGELCYYIILNEFKKISPWIYPGCPGFSLCRSMDENTLRR
jgi:hypothetical protein